MPARKIKTPADLHSIKPQSKIGSSPETPVLPELPSFPDIAWRGVFDVYRQAMEGSTAASDVAHFCTLWAAVASALGRRIHMYSGGIVYPNVYLCNFGPTGDHKTTAQRRLKECDLLAGQTVRYVQNVGSTEGLSDLLSKAERGVYLCYWE